VSLLRAWMTLFWMSFRRLFWSGATLMVCFPILGCALFLLRRDYGAGALDAAAWDRDFQEFAGEFLVNVFALFVTPICALAYGTSSVGGDREDRTLLFLLVRPIPRSLVLLAKFAATLPLVVGLVGGSFWVYCQLAGSVGARAYELFLPSMLLSAVAYVSLFHLFAVTFRHATIVALVYALFMEFLIGNMPGIVKRVAVNYYGRSLMYEVGRQADLTPPDPRWFQPADAHTSAWALVAITVGGMLLAMLLFERREYRDLS
jgi:ABC-2 type transport system permease protein